MEKIQSILWSLVPLILIVVLSWLFSVLGAKKKQEAAGSEDSGGVRAGDQFFDFFNQGERRDEPLDDRPTSMAGIDPRSGAPETSHSEILAGLTGQYPVADHPARALQGPEVTAKPIKPKWWGA